MTRRWAIGLGLPLGLLLIVAVLFRWDWLIPVLEGRASAALGRPVGIAHLHVGLGRPLRITLDDVTIGNPPGFEAEPPLARIGRAAIALDAMAYLRDRELVIPELVLTDPVVEARQTADGGSNYDIWPDAVDPTREGGGPPLRLGALRISGGRAHALLAAPKADVTATIETREDATLQATARGSYAAQPFTATLTGGGIMALQAAERPWPIKLEIANGPTRITLAGSLRDPLKLAGADVTLDLRGPDLALLAPFTGVPFPPSPPYRLAGKLDYAEGRYRLTGATGEVGSSDVAGSLSLAPGRPRMLTADLHSRRVDLADLGGFIGAPPGRAALPGETPQQRARRAAAAASPRLLPTERINVPLLKAVDVRATYRAERILGRGMPFDSVEVTADVDDGTIRLHPLVFTVGRGRLSTEAVLTPRDDGQLQARADIALQRLDISRLLAAAGAGGAGTLGGRGKLESTGRSVAELLGRGNGSLTVVSVGGNISALLLDLSGLQFGNALLSALGIPERTPIECLVGDFTLTHGRLESRTLLLDTAGYLVRGSGGMDLATETLDWRLRTDSKHLTIGSLPASIHISGRLKDPSIQPDLTEMAARGGIAAGLGALFPPLALLPTIQLGVGENSACERLSRR